MASFNLLGFYYEEGSVDFPQNFSPNAPFGYNLINDNPVGPVFSYSINDVEKSFDSARMFSQPCTNVTTPQRSDTLLTEGAGTDAVNFFGAASPFVFSGNSRDKGWSDAFLILEWLYRNQPTASVATASVPPQGETVYKNIADEMIRKNALISKYQVGSISIVNSVNPAKVGRISNVSFSVQMDNGDLAIIIVYFDADDFAARDSSLSYAVYCFNYAGNSNSSGDGGDGIVSNAEIDNNVVSKIVDIMNQSRFNSYDVLDVQAYPRNPNGTYPANYVVHRFFIFTTTHGVGNGGKVSLDETIKRREAKRYIENNIFTTDIPQRKATYPALFTTTSVAIYPFYDNKITVPNSASIMEQVSPFSMKEMRLFLLGLGLVPDTDPIEIFYVGTDAGSGGAPGTKYRYPLVAVELATDSTIDRPISKRLSEYYPIPSQAKPNLQAANDPAVVFHYIVRQCLQICEGLVSLAGIDATYRSTYNIAYEPTTSGARDRASFSFQGVTWYVYGFGRIA